MDLLDTVGPMGDEAFGKAVDLLAAMERKGYFAFAKGGIAHRRQHRHVIYGRGREKAGRECRVDFECGQEHDATGNHDVRQ